MHIGVIHSIESYWLCFGALEQNQPEMEQREREFRELPEWLLFGGIDFDYICERIGTGKMRYDAILVPNLRTIRSTRLSYLESFAKSGGTVIFAGAVPTLVDAKPNTRVYDSPSAASDSRWSAATSLRRWRRFEISRFAMRMVRRPIRSCTRCAWMENRGIYSCATPIASAGEARAFVCAADGMWSFTTQ